MRECYGRAVEQLQHVPLQQAVEAGQAASTGLCLVNPPSEVNTVLQYVALANSAAGEAAAGQGML